MSILALLAILVGVLVLVALLMMGLGGQGSAWVQFYARGKECGFSLSELGTLKGLAVELELADPVSFFWSDKVIDRVIKRFSQKTKEEGRDKDPQVLAFLAKLYDFRKNIELDTPKFKSGIRSTRAIPGGQKMRVIVEGLGVFNSTLLQNHPQALVVSIPVGKRLPEGFRWPGRKLSVYFWRAEDAGYVFDSYVMEEGQDGMVSVLRIGHTDALFRTQKRRSVRARSKISAYLYVLKRLEGAYEKPERAPGMKCVVEDLSEDGAAVFIGGKAKPDMLIKLQFYIGELQVVMSGTVKGVEYNADKHQSLLHMQAVAPSPRMKNVILSYVYNVYDEEEAT